MVGRGRGYELYHGEGGTLRHRTPLSAAGVPPGTPGGFPLPPLVSVTVRSTTGIEGPRVVAGRAPVGPDAPNPGVPWSPGIPWGTGHGRSSFHAGRGTESQAEVSPASLLRGAGATLRPHPTAASPNLANAYRALIQRGARSRLPTRCRGRRRPSRCLIHGPAFTSTLCTLPLCPPHLILPSPPGRPHL